jgi:predicted CoA-binding protein
VLYIQQAKEKEQRMNTKQDVQDFLAQKTLAIVGLSRDEKAMSGNVNKELKAKGYRMLPVNPNAESIAGEKCYPSLAALPEKVGGVLVFTPPSQTEKVVREAAALGITRVWLQQGAQSDAALAACREKDLQTVSGKCIMMFAEPVATFHGVHRWFAKVFGQLPK